MEKVLSGPTNRESVSVLMLRNEALLPERIYQIGRHCFVVALLVSYVGEDLRQCFGVVHLYEMLVFFQRFFHLIVLVDAFRRVVGVGFFVQNALDGQPVGLCGCFVRPADGERCHGHDELRQPEQLYNGAGVIDGCAEETCSDAFRLGQVRKSLAIEQGVGGGVQERKEVVVARRSLSVFRPEGCSVEIGAEGQHCGGVFHHRLVEVCGCQSAFHFAVSCNHDGVKLQVSHRGSTLRLAQEFP